MQMSRIFLLHKFIQHIIFNTEYQLVFIIQTKKIMTLRSLIVTGIVVLLTTLTPQTLQALLTLTLRHPNSIDSLISQKILYPPTVFLFCCATQKITLNFVSN